ncbi:hypothetical protein [Microbacterium sp.]|uniref:IS1096 element passenger TnpR family protein n=1 Tax=Microbacterium sp. TaxID=51671 RepID=UPI0025DA5B15|nr:hypothetical protein [Microbacterium sp.]
MARTWLSVTVELLGGRALNCGRGPGRVFAVGPSHTFLQFADAINDAFARWDRSHVSMFTLADGRTVTDDETGAELAASIGGPLTVPIDMARVKVARLVEPGAEFQFTFDLGDGWTHRCVVEEEKVDPLEVLGIRPTAPLSYWGWGSIPDQYGRRWADDDGSGPAPRRPTRSHPMMMHAWPALEPVPVLDLKELRSALATKDAARLVAAVAGRDIDDALQQVGSGMLLTLRQNHEYAEPLALSVINRLTWRGGPGDRILAEDLLATLRGVPLQGRVLPVDLEMLSILLEGAPELSTGAYLDLRTGAVYGGNETDPMMVGEDAAIDVDKEPDRWIYLAGVGSREGWQTWRPSPSGSRPVSARATGAGDRGRGCLPPIPRPRSRRRHRRAVGPLLIRSATGSCT